MAILAGHDYFLECFTYKSCGHIPRFSRYYRDTQVPDTSSKAHQSLGDWLPPDPFGLASSYQMSDSRILRSCRYEVSVCLMYNP